MISMPALSLPRLDLCGHQNHRESHKDPFVLETRFHNEKSWEIETLHKL